MVRALGRRHLDEQRVDVLVGERLASHLAWLPVLYERDGLVGEQIQLIALLPQQHIDERVDAGGHRLVQRAGVQHVPAMDVVGGGVRPHGEERVAGRVEVVEQA